MMRMDVLIVGAGPAATSTALSLVRSGASVCVLARNEPATNIDVEVLAPEVRSELAALGLNKSFWQPIAVPCHGIRTAWGDGTPRYYSYLGNPHGDAIVVNRRNFHSALRRELHRAGVAVIDGRLLRTEASRSGRVIAAEHKGTTKIVHAKVIVDGSGRQAAIARSLGAQQTRIDNLCAVSTLLYSRDTRQELTVEATEHGWWYAAPPVDGRVLVCFLSDTDLIRVLRATDKDAWLMFLAQTQEVAAKVTVTSTFGLRCHPCYSATLKPGTGPRWLAVGDAAMALDPLASIGVLSAVSTSRMAAQAIMAYLDGKKESLVSFDQHRQATFAQYLHARLRNYAVENRWPGTLFWSRRNIFEPDGREMSAVSP